MKHNVEFKNFSPTGHLRELVETSIAHLERHAPNFPADAVFLRLVAEESASHTLYRVSLTCTVPGRTLAAREERHDPEEAVRAAFDELQRQLEKHKEMLSHSYLYRRPARREELRRLKVEPNAGEDRDPERFFALIEPHLRRLYNFARREIAYYLALGDLLPGEVTAADVVDTVVMRAYHQLARRPEDLQIDQWLLQLTMEHLAREARRRRKERQKMVHIEEDVPELPPQAEISAVGDEIFDFFQPDEDLRLEDLVADPFVPTPEEIVASRELQRYVNRTLAQMPHAWRRAFVLHQIEGLPIAEIARITSQSESEIGHDLEHAREYLTQRLRESGLVAARQLDQAALTFFATAAEVELPAALRNALQEKVRTQEQAGGDREYGS